MDEDEDGRTDNDLLTHHIAGDSSAFGILVSRHRDRLWSVALRTIRDPYEAEDALQDALINAFQNASQYRGDAAVSTWLYRIVVNASLDRLRYQSRRTACTLPDDLSSLLADSRDDVAEVDTSLTIMGALAQLPRDKREAVILVDLEGLSISEAASILQCPEGTIKSRCARGRSQLAEILGFLGNRTGTSNVIPVKGGESSG